MINSQNVTPTARIIGYTIIIYKFTIIIVSYFTVIRIAPRIEHIPFNLPLIIYLRQ